jgi:hypothetical protein
MNLHPPFEISSRLMACVKVGGAYISIEYCNSFLKSGRQYYNYCIDLGDKSLEVKNELSTARRQESLQRAMADLLSFLGAAAEAFDYKKRNPELDAENLDMFPGWVNKWAAKNEDELSMIQCEIEETPNLIEE